MTTILTHRGLDPSHTTSFLESSQEAFANQLQRGFGLEFDVRQTRDGDIVVMHDSTLERLTDGQDLRSVAECVASEIMGRQFHGGTIGSLADTLSLITRISSPDVVHALHLKASMQTEASVEAVLATLEASGVQNIFLFDVKPNTAHLIQQRLPSLALAPSVAHQYDIERYNTAVGGTLMSIDDAIKLKGLYRWVWLDEWDRRDVGGTTKKLYTTELFARLRHEGFLIGLVTPELHRHSPGLLGGEAHEDAVTNDTLHQRMEEIIALRPDALCTDYPDLVRRLHTTS